MERKPKTTNSKADNKNKKSTDNPAQNSEVVNALDSKFFLWTKKSKPFKQFPFLDNYLFSEFLNMENSKIPNGQENGHTSKMKDALKYLNLIKYIEQHSDSSELDALLNNVAFLYSIDKEELRKETGNVKSSVKKAPRNIPIEQYLRLLIEKNNPKSSTKIDDLDGIILSSPKSKSTRAKKNGKAANKEQQSTSDEIMEITEITSKEPVVVSNKKTRGRQAKNKEAKDDEIEVKPLEDMNPMKKKVKDNNSTAREVLIGDGREIEKDVQAEKAITEMKTRRRGKIVNMNEQDVDDGKTRGDSEWSTIKKKKRKKKGDESPQRSENEGEGVKEQVPEQYMELYVNNEVDSDDGEGFSFFFVNENVYNKTKHYFEKKPRPEQICSCAGGCNDPTICPCARYNFENCGKTACYSYDTKYEKKRILNHLIRKDMHIYECSSQCACNKSLCLNSNINEGTINRTDPADFIVERYKKVYSGQDDKLSTYSANMWGLKAKSFIPANTYVVEYCGEIITKKEGDRRGEKYDSINCNYLFDLNKHAEIEKVNDSSNTITLNVDGVCETRNISKLKNIKENFPLVIDAFFYGNHSRFVNHSCSPNLVALAVHTENRNILLPRIIFFALRDIEIGEELTIDYNCAPLKDLKNNELLICLCGAPNCRGLVYEEAPESDGEPA